MSVSHFLSCAMAEVVSCWPPALLMWVLSQAIPLEICSEHSGIGTSFYFRD